MNRQDRGLTWPGGMITDCPSTRVRYANDGYDFNVCRSESMNAVVSGPKLLTTSS